MSTLRFSNKEAITLPITQTHVTCSTVTNPATSKLVLSEWAPNDNDEFDYSQQRDVWCCFPTNHSTYAYPAGSHILGNANSAILKKRYWCQDGSDASVKDQTTPNNFFTLNTMTWDTANNQQLLNYADHFRFFRIKSCELVLKFPKNKVQQSLNTATYTPGVVNNAGGTGVNPDFGGPGASRIHVLNCAPLDYFYIRNGEGVSGSKSWIDWDIAKLNDNDVKKYPMSGEYHFKMYPKHLAIENQINFPTDTTPYHGVDDTPGWFRTSTGWDYTNNLPKQTPGVSFFVCFARTRRMRLPVYYQLKTTFEFKDYMPENIDTGST